MRKAEFPPVYTYSVFIKAEFPPVYSNSVIKAEFPPVYSNSVIKAKFPPVYVNSVLKAEFPPVTFIVSERQDFHQCTLTVLCPKGGISTSIHLQYTVLS